MIASELAARIEHTLLKPEATLAQVDQLCDEAIEYGFFGVCVNPIFVGHAATRIDCSSTGTEPAIVSVAGFPLGSNRTETKAEEARRAMGDGAREIDMVMHVGGLIAGDHTAVRRDIHELAKVVHQHNNPPGILKVIIEAAALTDEQIAMACRLCAEAEADYVKTSTGLHPAGGARVEHVRLMHRLCAPLKVKAAGGIRTAQAAIAMIDAGAHRIGCSASIAIMREIQANP